MSQKKRVRIYKAGGSTGAYINPTARWMMQMGGAPQQNTDEQIMIAVQQGILNGADPNDVYDSLVAQGMPKQQVEQIIRVVMDSIETMDEEAYVQESGDQQAAIELAQQEADLMNQQSQNQMNQFMDGAPDINEMIMEDDDYDDYDDEDDDDLFDMAKGGIPRKADFMKQIKQLGGKIKQGERPEDASSRFVSTFINSVRNANDAALLEKQAEEYYDNELLPQAQRGREARRARRQQRQMNRGINRIMRNTPVGYMGQGMLPQNIGVINPFAMPVGNIGQGMPMGYPGLQMANIEVHKTGLFGRPKQYSMTFNYNNPNQIQEAADVAKSTTQSITDEESKKQQEGKPNNKEEAQEVEQVVEQTTEQTLDQTTKKSSSTRKAKTPSPIILEEEEVDIEKEEPVVDARPSLLNLGLADYNKPKLFNTNVDEIIARAQADPVEESLINPEIALLEDEIKSLEQMLKVGKDKGKTDSNIYKENEKKLKEKQKELADRKKLLEKGITGLPSNQVSYITDPGMHFREYMRAPLQWLDGGFADAMEEDALINERLRYAQEGPDFLRAASEAWDYGQRPLAVATALTGASRFIPRTRTVSPIRTVSPQNARIGVQRQMTDAQKSAIRHGHHKNTAFSNYARETGFNAKSPAQYGPFKPGYGPSLQQGGIINPFEVNPLAEFIYGGNIPKAQEGWQRPKTFEEYRPKFGWERRSMSDEERAYEKEYADWAKNNPNNSNFRNDLIRKENLTDKQIDKLVKLASDDGRPSWFNDWLKENQNTTNAARQEAINRMNQGIIGYGDGRYNLPNTIYGNPYPYGRGYGNMPTMFNPYGRPVISNRQTWMQQRGLATDAQGNPVMNPQALPLTKFEVTRSGLFGRPRRWSAEFGNYNQGDNTQRPQKVVTDEDMQNAEAARNAAATQDSPQLTPEQALESFNTAQDVKTQRELRNKPLARNRTQAQDNTELADVSNLVNPEELQEEAPQMAIDNLPLRNYGRDELYTTSDLRRYQMPVGNLPMRPYNNNELYNISDLRRTTGPDYFDSSTFTNNPQGLDLLDFGAPTFFPEIEQQDFIGTPPDAPINDNEYIRGSDGTFMINNPFDSNEAPPFLETPSSISQSSSRTSTRNNRTTPTRQRKSFIWGNTNAEQDAISNIIKEKDSSGIFNVDGVELRSSMKTMINDYSRENNIDPVNFDKFKRSSNADKWEFIQKAKKAGKQDLYEILLYLAESGETQPENIDMAQKGGIPRYQTAGTTPLYLSNPFEEDDNAILNMGQRNDYGQVIIPDYSQPPAMQTQEGFDDYFSPETSIERAADLVGTGEGTAEIVPRDPSGYKTKGKFKDQFDVDFGAAWDLANYGVRSATNYLRDAEQERQHNLGMLSMDPNAMYAQRDRGDYHTNPGLGSNFRNPSTGFKGVAQRGGQFNIGDELEMTDKEIAEFIAAGGKLKFV